MMAEALNAFRVAGGALGVLAGLALLVTPRAALREPTRLRTWLLEIDFAALLDRRRSVERFLYRHHRAFGAMVIAGALGCIAALLRLGAWTIPALAPAAGQIGVVAMAFVAWTLALFALVIGVIVLIRPSALKQIETAANRWIDPFPWTEHQDVSNRYDIVGRFVQRFPRLAGALLFAAGLLCLDAFPK